MTTWAAVLDDFEAAIQRAEAWQPDDADHTEPPAPFEPPALTTAFPPELTERAHALLVRADTVSQQLRDAQNGIRAELARLPRGRGAEGPRGARFELHA